MLQLFLIALPFSHPEHQEIRPHKVEQKLRVWSIHPLSNSTEIDTV